MISIIGPSIAGGAPIVQTPGSGDIPPTFDEALLKGIPALAGYGSDYGVLDTMTFTDGTIADITDNGDGTADLTVNSAGTPLLTMIYPLPPVLNPFDESGEARQSLLWNAYCRFVSQAAGTDFRIGAGVIYTTAVPGALNGTFFARAVDADYAAIVYADKLLTAAFYELSVVANRKERWRKDYAGAPAVAGAAVTANTDPSLFNGHTIGSRTPPGAVDIVATTTIQQTMNSAVGNVGIESADFNFVAVPLANVARAYGYIQMKSFGIAGDCVMKLVGVQGGFGNPVTP